MNKSKIMLRSSIMLVPGLMIGLMIISGGCDKFRDNRETITAADNSLAIQGYGDVFKKVDEHSKLKDGTVGKTAIDTCATVSITTTGGNFPKTMTINFGETNCEGLYGVDRRGIITANYSNGYKAEGTLVIVTLDGYHANNFLYDGDVTITNLGENAAGNTEYSVKVEDGVITTLEDELITWAGTMVFEWVEGAGTLLYVFDDVYHVTGTASGSNREGTGFDMAIGWALKVLQGCHWPVSGELKIEPFDLKDREVDYDPKDTEVCDNHAEVTIGKNREIGVNLR